MKKLCSELGIVDEKQLKVLKAWCHDHVSKDIHFTGTDAIQYEKYYKLAKDYLENFLAHAKKNLLEPVQDFSGLDTLQYAAKCGYHYFIDNQPLSQDILDHPNHNKMTPLHISASLGFPNTVEVLLTKGASPHVQNRQRQLPIFWSLFLPMIYEAHKPAQKKAIFKMLASRAGDTLLAQDQDGETLLHKIAEHEEFVDLFNELDPSLVFVANQAGRYPIHTSILNGQIAVMKHLLAIDGVINQVDGRKRTPLHYAARYGNENTVRLCVEHGAVVDAHDSEGQTPLMMAASAGKCEVVKYLIKHGACATIVDANGKSAFDYAKESENQNMVNCIGGCKSLGT